MSVLRSSWVILPLLFHISAQQCTIEDNFASFVISTEVTSAKPSMHINSTYYNCLSRSDTSDHYSSMSVSIVYTRSDDSNNTHEVRYNLQCNNSVWEIVGNQSTALRSNMSYYCSDCTNQTVNDYHCTSSHGCQLDQDANWTITWPPTDAGDRARRSCPGRGEIKGFAYRNCFNNNSWGPVHVENCQTAEISRIQFRSKALKDEIINQTFINQAFMASSMIIKQLEIITWASSARPILPRDLLSIAIILRDILFVSKAVMMSLNKNNNGPQLRMLPLIEGIIRLLDYVLDEKNDLSFDVVKNMTNKNNLTVGEQFQVITERIGILLSMTLPRNAANISMDRLNFTNIIVIAQIITKQGLMDEDFVEFSASLQDRRRAYMRIPTVPIQTQMRKRGRRPPVINIISRNVHLPTKDGVRIASLVLSGKISTDFDAQTSLGDSRAVMGFTIENSGFASNPRCSFFSYSRNDVTSGTFSSDGITLNRNTNSTFVQCATTHLTSFAVLVDVSGESNTNTGTALSIISYIGCAISIVCLLISVCLLILLRKKVFYQEQHFLHLNLSIALLLGLLTFVSGIEAASEYRASCLTVAILLHYFFMAVFSWMLCEGILLFIMIKLVFYRGFFKSKIFFLLLGWGLPIPIVAVSAGVSHNQYNYKDICWISEEKGAIWAFIGPMLLIIMINSFFLVVAIYELYKTNRKGLTAADMNYKNTIKPLVRAAVIIVPLLGVTWVVGIFAVNENTVVFAWIFTILNSLQGVCILILYVLKNEKFLLLCRRKLTQNFSTTVTSSKDITAKEEKTRSRFLSTDIASTTTDTACTNDAVAN